MAKKILIVDDEPDLLKVTIFRLKAAGYEILSATDGEAGLEIVRTKAPDLVLLDLLMPKMSGVDVCKAIKADERLKGTLVILFTASVLADVAAKVKESGADDYVIKPFDPTALLEKIKKFIG